MVTDDPIFRVMLVDDEPVIQELVRAMLSTNLVEVEVAANGLECIKSAQSRGFDLILLDIVLPGMDGIAICRLLKSTPVTASIPVYMLTAKSKVADMESARRAGAEGYINKPFRGTELMELVESLRSKRLVTRK